MRKITAPWRRNTHMHSSIQNKDALTKSRTSYVVLNLLKPTEHTNTHNNNILHGGSRDEKKSI